jgi:hypothetical protein
MIMAFSPCYELNAQDTVMLTSADSAQIRVATLRILIDSLAESPESPGRIWISGSHQLRRDTASARQFALSDTQWAAISQAFPTARHVVPTDSLFLCPAGVELRMPGSGCPIKEDGIVVELAPLRVDADSVTSSGLLVQSSTSYGRLVTWAQGMWLVFERVQGRWRVRAIRGRFIT